MIIYNSILPVKGFTAINLFGVIFARKEYKPLPSRVLNHENIHNAQMKELLFVGFCLLYVIDWIILLFKRKNAKEAYRNIRFEKEAYANDNDLHYIKNRKKYSWRYY